MPKPSLNDNYQQLESELIETFLAGHHEWRPDLPYPESHSDMSGGMRALMRMFEIKRRPIALPVKDMLADREKKKLLVLKLREVTVGPSQPEGLATAENAFDHERDPIGGRDWVQFWKGWLARASSTPAATKGYPRIPPKADRPV